MNNTKVTKHDIRRIINFAKKVAPKLANRNNKRSIDEAINDICIGKLGEMMAAKHYNLGAIDLSVFKPGVENDDCDLYHEKHSTIEVKTIPYHGNKLIVRASSLEYCETSSYIVVQMDYRTKYDNYKYLDNYLIHLSTTAKISKIISAETFKEKAIFVKKGQQYAGAMYHDSYVYNTSNKDFLVKK